MEGGFEKGWMPAPESGPDRQDAEPGGKDRVLEQEDKRVVPRARKWIEEEAGPAEIAGPVASEGQPRINRGRIIWCWAQRERGFW